jgi:ectoine hydroxylase-related dioxygenase (phytanoyl-CoA dioxygenase family)
MTWPAPSAPVESLDQRAAAAATPLVVQAFQRDGAVCLRGLLNTAEIAQLRAGIDTNLAQPSPRAKVASRADDPGFFVEDFCNWQDNADYQHVIMHSPLAATAGRLMRSTTARLYHDHMLTKEPGTQQRTPWHQDQPYYNVEGQQNVSFWIAVDPVRRHSTLALVRGSHAGPWLMPRTFLSL